LVAEEKKILTYYLVDSELLIINTYYKRDGSLLVATVFAFLTALGHHTAPKILKGLQPLFSYWRIKFFITRYVNGWNQACV
jgi:hypothetical protein